MRRPAAPRVSGALRRHRLLICVTASAALVVPLLTGRLSGGPDDHRLQSEFTDAADEFHVPRNVLMGVAYLQSRWDSHPGAPSVVGGYGPMHLTDPEASRRAGTAPGATAAGPPGTAASTPAQDRSAPPADLHRAARLTGVPVEKLRTDTAANVRAGAALLAETQRRLGKSLSAGTDDWWEAVARFPGTGDKTSAATYADDVFAVIRKGAHRTTDTGQRVTLPASPGVRPHRPVVKPPRPKEVECPAELDCSWLAAPYVQVDGSYGNHDLADRPRDEKIEYIVIHDTEANLPSMFQTVQDPTEASWHYSIRSKDGHVTQHIRTKDMAWHSGNQLVNARSIGIEHEGFLTRPNTWYTEQMYRSSARLVRYLAKKYGIPLDRQHIFGHDNVPAPTGGSIPSMHDDPGPFWDWRHYFDLLGAPLRATGPRHGAMVTILPDFATHKPSFTGCPGAHLPCAPHGSSAVRLYTEPSESAPLIQDPGRHPDGADSTEDVHDLGSRVSAGQTFAVAARRGDWTAIWFQGREAWFKNSEDHPTAVGAGGRMVTPREGLDVIQVFGRALPESGAYPKGMKEPTQAPLPYEFLAGQRYVTQSSLDGSYVDRSNFVETPSPVVKGSEEYYEIQFGHRLAYVRASDVDVVDAPVAAGPESEPGQDGQARRR
ncbi:N-acetylmuramoyl-L-alanine amidase [Streptomyces sp. NPDC059378]|uniref:N-acetylmuramoyl-L-alanine amidase n=1 Tax=Streptomyces sp. NPDC059378 TaxID=3346815 RepID=UPI0036A85216